MFLSRSSKLNSVFIYIRPRQSQTPGYEVPPSALTFAQSTFLLPNTVSGQLPKIIFSRRPYIFQHNGAPSRQRGRILCRKPACHQRWQSPLCITRSPTSDRRVESSATFGFTSTYGVLSPQKTLCQLLQGGTRHCYKVTPVTAFISRGRTIVYERRC